MSKMNYDAVRGGYGMRYYFNAGTDKRTCKTDEEGTEFYDENTDKFIGTVEGYAPYELEEMDEEKFQQILEENFID